MKRSVRMQSNRALGAYEYYFSDNPTPENDPVFPEETFVLPPDCLPQAGPLRRQCRPPRHSLSSRSVVNLADLPFRCVIAVDFEFEFGGVAGNRPRPVCLVAKNLLTGQISRVWRGEFGSTPPFPVGPETLFVAYFASAEIGCFRALGWPTPARILDLFAEFRNHTNGSRPPFGNGLIGALGYFGCDTIGAHYKKEMVELVLKGGPWSAAQREAILDYCAGDVLALERRLPAMLPHIDLPRALLRGRYMAAVAAIEFNGTPIDVPTLERLRERWEDIKGELIAAIDTNYGVYEQAPSKKAKFEAFLVHHNIPWPRLESGRLDSNRPSARWPRLIQSSHRCTNCGMPSLRCA